MEDPTEDEYTLPNENTKRQGSNVAEMSQSLNTILSQPPLGLRLTITSSLIHSIEKALSRHHSSLSSYATSSLRHETGKKKDLESTGKFKATHLAACHLRIGSWEFDSRYGNALVAKFYYAKHKLIWEILDGGLKRKIEIQWSDILAMKATYSNDIDTLNIMLARQPHFYREVNPEPRKHTVWQGTSDFTNEQATISRKHFLKCRPGTLRKNFEMLIQSDSRLKLLSEQSETIPSSLYFEPEPSDVSEVNDESHRRHGCVNLIKGGFNSNIHVLHQVNGLASTAPSTSYSNNEISAAIAPIADVSPMEKTSPSSAIIDTHYEEDYISVSDSMNLRGEDSSIAISNTMNLKGESYVSKSDFMNLAGEGNISMSNFMHHRGEGCTSINPQYEINPSTDIPTIEELERCLMSCIDSNSCPMQQEDSVIDVDGSPDHNKFALENVQQSLDEESQLNLTSDEQPLMPSVDSVGCLTVQEESVVDVDNVDESYQQLMDMLRVPSPPELLIGGSDYSEASDIRYD